MQTGSDRELRNDMRPTLGFGLILSAAMTGPLGGCSYRDELGPSRRLASSPEASNRNGRRERPEEAIFADLERRVPGTAGFFLDTEGKVIVVVRDVSREAESITAIKDLLRSDATFSASSTSNRAITTTRGQYSFSQLAEWRNIAFDRVLASIAGVTSLDLAEQLNRIAIGLSRAHYSRLRTALPAQLAEFGVDTFAVSFREHDFLLSRARPAGSMTPYLYSMSQLPGGINGPNLWEYLVGGLEVTRGSGVCTLAGCGKRLFRA